MKIYFTASLRGKERFQEEYKLIVRSLEELGYQVHEHILQTDPEKPDKESPEEKVKIYQKLLRFTRASALVVAEVSSPSLSVGHEISLALELNKPVIALHLEGHRPRLLEGNPDEKLHIIPYNHANLKSSLKESLNLAMDQIDVRFNFFIPPRIVIYLNWVAKKRKIPRSVFLRSLLEEEMKKDKEFQREGR